MFYQLIKSSGLALLLLINIQSFAQKSSGVPLEDYLKEAEQVWNVRFTYADHNIRNIEIDSPKSPASLENLLRELTRQTGLRFQRINDRFVAIRARTSGDEGICGILIDKTTNETVAYATIRHGNHFTTSDETGFFELLIDNTDSLLIIQRLGYQTMVKGLESQVQEDCLQLFLEPEAFQLDEVTVNRLMTRGVGREAGGRIIINVDELGILPGLTEPDVLQAIQALPGIQSTNETISDINIRGGTNDQNLILWDGIKMYQSGHFFGMISAFNPYLNSHVNITKNGTSAFYGDGVSGTIDIRSKENKPAKLEGGAGINLINADLFLRIPISRKVTLQLAGRRAITDLIRTPLYKNYFNRTFSNTDVIQAARVGTDTTYNSDENFYFYDITGNLIVDVGKQDRLKLNFQHIFNSLQYQENVSTGLVTDSKTSSLKQTSTGTGLQYRRVWNNRLKSNLETYFSSYQLEATNFNIPNDQRVTQENQVLETGIKLDTRWLINQKLDFLAGYQFFETGISNLEDVNNPEFYRFIKEVIRSQAIFAELNFLPNSGTEMRFGLRGNYIGKFKKILVEPRLSISQKLTEGLSIELLGEFKNQTSAQVIDLQNDFLGVEKRRWLLSNNKEIPVIKSKQASLALIHQGVQFHASIAGFYRFVSGISSASQGFLNQFQYEQTVGDYEVLGSEILINWQKDPFSVWSGYTISKNQYRFEFLDPQFFPNNLDVRHSLSAGINWQFGHLETSLGFNWRSGKPYTPAIGVSNDDILYAAPNSSRLPDYLRLDLSIRYRFKFSDHVGGQVGGSIWNLTNHTNIFNIFYQREGESNIRTIEQQALALSPNLSFRVTF